MRNSPSRTRRAVAAVVVRRGKGRQIVQLSRIGNPMHLDFAQLSPRDAYQWMTHTILPRPIAWVATIGADGRTNLAPFSFFQGITANPPTLMFSPVNDRTGRKKDTVVNIEQVPEFVVNLVSRDLAEAMNRTSATLPYGDSEFAGFGIAPAPSERVRPPRVAAAKVAFECRLDRVVPIGEGPLAAHVVFGRILLAHIRDDVLAADGVPRLADAPGGIHRDVDHREEDGDDADDDEELDEGEAAVVLAGLLPRGRVLPVIGLASHAVMLAFFRAYDASSHASRPAGLSSGTKRPRSAGSSASSSTDSP